MHTFKNIHLIINPASGNANPPFEAFTHFSNTVDANVFFHVTQAHYSGDKHAQDAIEAGADLIIAYGGDGTVMEVTCAIEGHDVPIAVMVGGTASIIANELGIPENPQEALQYILDGNYEKLTLDAGKVNDAHFLLRLGIGWEAELSQRPDTEEKSRWGTLAYTKSALAALMDLDATEYKLTLDNDEEITVEGINCSICNIGNVGIPNITIDKDIKPNDGILDVVILQNKHIQGILDIVSNLAANTFPNIEIEEQLAHYQAKSITVELSESQRISCDGEAVEWDFPLTIDCVPDYATFLKPKLP